MTQNSASEQQFEFNIGWSAWTGMSIVYVLASFDYKLKYWTMGESAPLVPSRPFFGFVPKRWECGCCGDFD